MKQHLKKLFAALIAAYSSFIQIHPALAGVELVDDFTPGQESSAFSTLEVVDGNLAFTAGPAGVGNSVNEYAVDTNNTLNMLGRNEDRFNATIDFDGKTYYAGGNSVYVENDTQGYLLVAEFPRDDYGSNGITDYFFDSFYSDNDKLFFIMRGEDNSRTGLYIFYALYEVDTAINTVNYVTPSNYYPFGEPTDDRPDIRQPDFYYRLGSERVTLASAPNTGQEFWAVKGEGSDRKIQLLADINPGSTDSYSRWILDFNGESYFTANGDYGRELYKINTDIEIERVTDIHPNGASFVYGEESAFVSNDTMYFLAQGAGNIGYSLWKIDAAEQNPFPVKEAIKDTFAFAYNTYRTSLFKVADTSIGVVFIATNAITQQVNVWFSDGTSDGTVALPLSDADNALALGNGKLLISVQNGNSDFSLWLVDLNDLASPIVLAEGEQEIRIFSDSADTTSNTGAVSIANGTTGYELWFVDGNDESMSLIREFADIPYGLVNEAKPLGKLGNKFLFAADDGSTGMELWVSDNTAAGTSLVKDIAVGTASSYSVNPEGVSDIIDGLYYFHADDGVNGTQMWVTDGTERGTHMFDPISSVFELRAQNLVPFNGDVYFVSDSDEYGKELFKYKPESESNPPSTGTGAFGDYVWEDSNGDGIQEGSELGIEGVTVELQTCSGDVVATTTTDSMGAYRFDNVAADEFQLQFKLPSGYHFSPEKATDDYTLDSNANETTGNSPCYDMSQGWKRLAVDAGLVPDDTGTPPDTLTVVRAIYFSETNQLWVRAESDAMPEGSALITASVTADGTTTSLGPIGWKEVQGYYQRRFKNLQQTPSSVSLTSEAGGSVTADVEVR